MRRSTLNKLKRQIGRLETVYINAIDYGADRTGVSGSSSAIQAALDAGGSACTVILPDGFYKIDSPIFLDQTGQRLIGMGQKNTILVASFASDPIITIGNEDDFSENQEAANFLLTTSVTRGGAGIYVDYSNKVRVTNIKMETMYNGIQLGDTDPVECLATYIENCDLSVYNDGIYMTSPAGTYVKSTNISGNDINNPGSNNPGPGVGIRVTSSADGLWVDANSVIQTCQRGVSIQHSAGSVAEMNIAASLAFHAVAAIEVAMTSTAALNGLYLAGPMYTGRSTGDVFFLGQSTSSGSAQNLSFKNCRGSSIGQRFIQFASGFANLDNCSIVGCSAHGGAAQAAATYPAITLPTNGNHITVNSNTMTGQHTYGMDEGASTTNIVVTGNNFEGSAGVFNNVGAASATRIFANNVGA